MIHYTLNQDTSSHFGCVWARNGLVMGGLELPMYSSGGSVLSSVFPHEERSDADTIFTSRRNSVGDRRVSNVQVGADVSPNVIEESMIGPGFNFLGSTFDYLVACKTSYTAGVFDMVGTCFYDATKKVAFVPIQNSFGSHTQKVTNYSDYYVTTDTTMVYSWVPLGKNYALIATSYSAARYSKYSSNNFSGCSVTVYWTETANGSTNYRTASLGSALWSFGNNAKTDAIRAFALTFVPDPTKIGQAKVDTLTPIDGVPNARPYLYTRRYDPKASDEANISFVKTRLSNAGFLCWANSLSGLPTYDEWADLADSAIDNCKFVDINAYAFTRDLRSTLSELKAAQQVIANPLNPKKWANLYLGLRYGTRLTIADTRELMAGLKRSSENMRSTWSKDYNIVRSMKVSSPPDLKVATSATRTLHYKVYYKPKDGMLNSMMKSLWDWDMYPSLQNIWDLVPYSFCVDWGGNIEGVLEKIDRRQYEELIHVLGCTYSFKDEYFLPIVLSDLGFQDTTLVVTVYSRSTSSLHQSSLRLTTGHSSAINVLDGISLILQRVK